MNDIMWFSYSSSEAEYGMAYCSKAMLRYYVKLGLRYII